MASSRKERHVTLHILMPEELHIWFKDYCHDRGVSMTEVLVAYLYKLKNRDNKPVIKEF